MRYIIWPEDSGAAGLLGGKAGSLAALRRTGLPIPEWFVLAPEAFEASLGEANRQARESPEDPAALLARIGDLTPAPEIVLELTAALVRLCPKGERVAVRSSASEEDGIHHSFAGQLDTFLFVRPSDVADRVAAVWRSGVSPRVLAYRRQHGLSSLPRPPAVLIQRMVNASPAGVAFSADPVTGRRGVAVVTATYGLGSALVSGECAADTYHVDREGCILNRAVALKRLAHRYAPDSVEGVRSVEVSADEATRTCLTDEEIRAVAALARQVGRHFGSPQDIEWALEDGRLSLLQSRPITSLSQMPDPDGVRILWDSSNIAESYGGVTTPLTFSFARRAYEEVYRQFCRIMRVPSGAVAAHEDAFRCMLGLIRGRVYYNLLNWYRVLALLPGFTFNRHFMEQMMGVRETLPEDLLPKEGALPLTARLGDGFRLLVTLGGLVVNYLLLPSRIRRFDRRLDHVLASVHPPLEDMRADELASHYHHLERALLTRWDAPLINDFFAMIFHGLLRRLTGRWCDEKEGTLHNDLLCNAGDVISTEPMDRLREMAEMAAQDRDFVTRLRDDSLDSILHRMEGLADFKQRYLEYIDRFGERCLGELKLESPTLRDNPLPLLRSVGELASRLLASGGVPGSAAGTPVRLSAERGVHEALAYRPIRRLVFCWVLRQARARVRDRENLRFQRTRVFGHTRTIFLEFAKRFCSLELLDSPRDIFYLEVNEILGFVEGTISSANLRGLVALRKAEYGDYQATDAPPERHETRGIVNHGHRFTREERHRDSLDGDHRKGIGCCRGIVRGPVRVVTHPNSTVIRPGEILVAERTDPGWIILFTTAAGLLVERGSLLSHSAIVARELGLPAVVSIPGLTHWVRDGDWVELDGGAGIVRRIIPPEEQAKQG